MVSFSFEVALSVHEKPRLRSPSAQQNDQLHGGGMMGMFAVCVWTLS